MCVSTDRAIKGVPSCGAGRTTDSRAGAALVIAGLVADGVTLVSSAKTSIGVTKMVEKLRGRREN